MSLDNCSPVDIPNKNLRVKIDAAVPCAAKNLFLSLANRQFHTDNIFLSYSWHKQWVSQIGEPQGARALSFYDGDELIGFIFLSESNIRRRKFFRRRILYVNEHCVGDNNLVLEYNGIICEEKYTKRCWQAFVSWLMTSNYKFDEINLNLMQENDALSAFEVFKETAFCIEISEPHVCPVANISTTNLPWEEIEKRNISSNKRRQIRKSCSLYEQKYGSLKLEVAESVDQALTYFDELAKLHTQYWNERGSPGAFTNEVWLTFQKNLIAEPHNNCTQLIKVSAGKHVIGYLYNLVCQSNIYNIQSGLSYQEDNKLRPGFTCHYLAMKKNAEIKMIKYHFLAGGESYKVSLSDGACNLYWLTIRKKKVYLIEDSLVFIVRSLRSLLGLAKSKIK